jgi:hypothetical protein
LALAVPWTTDAVEAPADQVGGDARIASIGDAGDLELRHVEELLHGEVRDGGGTLVPVVECARLLLRGLDQVGDGAQRRLGAHRQHHGVGEGLAHGHERVRLVAGLHGLGRRIDRDDQRGREQERVAVGFGARDRCRTGGAAGARPIDHDELLAEPARQSRGKAACQDVRRAAGLVRIDDLHDAARIVLGVRGERQPCGERGDCGERRPARNDHPLAFHNGRDAFASLACFIYRSKKAIESLTACTCTASGS